MKYHFFIFNNGLVSEGGMSGSDQRAYQWSQLFKKKGHQVTLFIPHVGLKRFKNLGFDLVITTKIKAEKYGYFLSYLWQALKGCLAAKKLGKLEQNSIVYASCDLIADSIPAIFLKIKNPQAKLLCGLHLLAPNPFKGYTHQLSFPKPENLYYFLSQRLIIKFLKWWADLVLVSNHLDEKFLLKKGFRKNQVLVTYGGVNFKLIPKKSFRKKFSAVWVGRLHPQKGIDDLFLAWQKVTRKLPRAELAVVGEDNLKEYFLKQKVSSKLKNNLIFTGYLDSQSLFRVLKSSQLFLCPSFYESFGMVIAEAMACGLAVIAYNLPVYQKIYPGGMIRVPIGKVNLLAKKTIYLLTHIKVRKKMGYEALKVAQKFRWQKTAKQILKALNV